MRRLTQGEDVSLPHLSAVACFPAALYVSPKGRHAKLLTLIISGRTDANVGFDSLLALLRQLGFTERTKGSHHVFRRAGVEEMINLQRDGDKAKVYQVRQVRAVLSKHGLTTLAEPEED